MFREKSPDYMMGPICVKKSSVEGAGYGVFATADIPRGVLVEVCPVLLFHNETLKILFETTGGDHLLADYVFRWMPGRTWDGQMALAMGYGSMYNHSDDNLNVMFQYRADPPAMEYFTTRDVVAGEELFIRYVPGGIPLWFDSSDRSIEAYQDEWYGEGWQDELE